MGYFSSGLTLNKLSILYFMRSLSLPLTSEQLIEADSREEWMGYFNMRQSLADLHESGLIGTIQSALGDSFVLSEAGLDAIAQFEKRIPESQRAALDNYAKENKQSLLNERRYSAKIKKEAPMEYRVSLKAYENEQTLFELSLLVTSRAAAQRVCDEWSLKAPAVYKSIMTQLQ